MEKAKVAVIGAGVSGLACASALQACGVTVNVYDKGRGPGGRCSSRRSPFGRFDHGAQFFTVRDERFADQVARWADAGAAAVWDGDFVRIADGTRHAYTGDDRWVGKPAFNGFVRHEAERLGAEFGLRLAPPVRGDGECRWKLFSETGQSAWAADWVVYAVPAEQAADLLPRAAEGGSDALVDAASAACSEPTLTLMAAFEGEGASPFDGAALEDGPLSWISREASKPGRDPGARWVAHASSGWSRDHLEADPASLVAPLVSALREATGESAPLVHGDVHRWRYAQVTETADGPFGLDEASQLATCGDWHVAPRIESAWLSGHALGRALAERLA